MKKLSRLAVLMIVILTLTGCWDQNIYENMGFILNIGMDMGPEGKMLYTVSSPIVSESTGGDSQTGSGGGGGGEMKKMDVNLNEAYLLREARDMIRLSTARRVEGGKVQNIMYSKEFAEQRRISEYLEVFERDTQSTLQSWVIIVDGSARELIEKGAQFKGKPRLGIYLNELLKRNEEAGYCAGIRIFDYDIKNTTPGISPVVTMVKLGENEVTISGTALIDRDKMTGRLDTEESVCLFIAMGKTKKSRIVFGLPKEMQGEKKKGIVAISKVNTKTEIKLKDNTPELNLKVKLKVTVEEYTWGNLADPEFKKKMETCLNEEMRTRLKNMFAKLQAAKCDALGIGEKVRAFHYDYWKSIGELDGWKKVYSDMKVNFDVQVEIIRYGEIG